MQIYQFKRTNVSRAQKKTAYKNWMRTHTYVRSIWHTHKQKHPWKIYTQQRYWCLSTLVTPFDSTFRDTHIANGMQRMRSDGVGKASKQDERHYTVYIHRYVCCAVLCCAMCIHTHSQTQMIPLMGN